VSYKVSVLGAGRIGGAIASFCTELGMEVTAVDPNKAQLDRVQNCSHVRCEDPVNNTKVLHDIFDNSDVTVCALPGAMGNFIVGQAAEYGTRLVDISYAPEDSHDAWNETAIAHGAQIVIDIGVAPGIANVYIGRAIDWFDEVHNAAYYVGGLPVIRRKPFEYTATWSPADIIEEYTRPARYKEFNTIKSMEVFSDLELMDIPGVGTVEAFSTDGLRTLLTSTDIPNLKEKTLRWPGHAKLITMLRDIGLFNKNVISAGPYRVTPRYVAEALLKDQWKPEEDDPDFTVLKVEAEGIYQGKKSKVEYFLKVESDQEYSSMALSTGWPAAIAAYMMCEGKFFKGVCRPEVIGMDPKLFRPFEADLRGVGLYVSQSIKEIES